MNLKRLFGTILTSLGIIILIYGGYMFMSDANNAWKAIIVALLLGIIFFGSGIGLVKGTKDEA